MLKLVMEQEDFIHAPKYGNSLTKYLSKNDNPLEDAAIARLLLIEKDQVEKIYQESIEALKKEMVDEESS